MKHKYLPQLYGVVKDYHPRSIPENKVQDCLNVMFRQGRVRRRFGYAELGPVPLNGIVNGIAYYEQVRLGDRFTIVFTNRDALLYNTETGLFSPITPCYNTGTVECDCLDVTGTATVWNHTAWTEDTYQIKFGTNDASVNEIYVSCDSALELISLATLQYFMGVATDGAGGIVAIETILSPYALRSPDGGDSWLDCAAITTIPKAIAYCNGYFYIFYNGGNVDVSNDGGATWAGATAFSDPTAAGFQCHAESPSSIIIGVAQAAVAGSLNFYRSDDNGVSWTAVMTSMQQSHICYGNGIYLISQYNGDNYISTDDGLTFNPVANPNYPFNMRMWFLEDRFYCYDVLNYNLYSTTDGINYTFLSQKYHDGEMSRNGDVIYRTHMIADYVEYSLDFGVTWTTLTVPGSHHWTNMVYDGLTRRIFFFGRDATSLDSIMYQTREITPTTLDNLYIGMPVHGQFVPDGSRILEIDDGSGTFLIDNVLIDGFVGDSLRFDLEWFEVNTIVGNTSLTLDPREIISGDTTNGSEVITNIADTSILHVGMGITGAGIPVESYIYSIDSSSQITLNNAATATAAGVSLYLGVYVYVETYTVDYILKLCFSGEEDDFWSFAFPYDSVTGDKILVATNGIDPIKKWDGTGWMEDLGGAGIPDTAKIVDYFGAAAYEHLLAAWTTDTGDNMPQTIEVSDAGDPEGWSGTYYDLLQQNDEIKALEILKGRIVVYKSNSISLMWATPEGGNTDPMDIDQDIIVDVKIMSGRTVVNFGDFHIFLALDNVYAFNGISIQPIGSEIINTMKNEWNGEYMNRAFAFSIPTENLYCLFIPTMEERDPFTDEITKEVSEWPDKAYVYNYAEKTWTIWKLQRQMTCSGNVLKQYAPTIGEIDTQNLMWSEMNMRWSDLIAYSNQTSLLLGDADGYVNEFRDVYSLDNNVPIEASFMTRDYELNDPKHVFMLLEAVLGMTRQSAGQIEIRASTDFGLNWSEWVPVDMNAGTPVVEYVEYIANFIRKGLQVRLEVRNVGGSYFELESIMVGFNDEMGKKK